MRTRLSSAAIRALAALCHSQRKLPLSAAAACAELVAADLADREGRVTAAGRAYLARITAAGQGLDPFRAQHLDAEPLADGRMIDHGESPLTWLARRKGRDGRALIEPHQQLAGERLRADFTRGQLTPRVTANWDAAVTSGRRGEVGLSMTDVALAARERVEGAVRAVGPEFSGLLLDVCCFLKKLDTVESERGWPVRSAKVVLQLGLDRLARHYGLAAETSGTAHSPLRAARFDPVG